MPLWLRLTATERRHVNAYHEGWEDGLNDRHAPPLHEFLDLDGEIDEFSSYMLGYKHALKEEPLPDQPYDWALDG